MLWKSDWKYDGVAAGAFLGTVDHRPGLYETTWLPSDALVCVTKFGIAHGAGFPTMGEPRRVNEPYNVARFGDTEFRTHLIRAVESINGPLLWAVTLDPVTVGREGNTARARVLYGFYGKSLVAILAPVRKGHGS